jgi:hypothetical protein
MNKKQIFIIHGGKTFSKRKDYLENLKEKHVSLEKRERWREEYLDQELGSKFQIIRPRMPCKKNAHYEEWKIYFERFISLLRDDIIFIGYSLGGVFLAKYLSENKFPKKIKGLYLVAAPFDDSIEEEELCNGFELRDNLSLIEENCSNIKLFFSEDDNIVPISHAQKYKDKISKAEIIICKNKNGHFQVSEFPELVRHIKDE